MTEKSHIQPPSLKEQGLTDESYLVSIISAYNIYLGYFPVRYFVSVMAFFGMVCLYMLRININFAIIAMVLPANDSNVEISDQCPNLNYSSIDSSDSYVR